MTYSYFLPQCPALIPARQWVLSKYVFNQHVNEYMCPAESENQPTNRKQRVKMTKPLENSGKSGQRGRRKRTEWQPLLRSNTSLTTCECDSTVMQ